jgi:hypothetical protein
LSTRETVLTATCARSATTRIVGFSLTVDAARRRAPREAFGVSFAVGSPFSGSGLTGTDTAGTYHAACGVRAVSPEVYLVLRAVIGMDRPRHGPRQPGELRI